MPPYKPPQKRSQEDAASSGGRPPKRGKAKKQEPTYDTYETAMEGGVEFEEKGERYQNGERAQRNYERSLELYIKAWGLERTWDAGYNQARVLYTLGTAFLLPPTSIEYLRKSLEMYEVTTTLESGPLLQLDGLFNYAQTATSLADQLEEVQGDIAASDVRDLRGKAILALERVLAGQAEYLDKQASASAATSKESTPAVADTGEDASMDVDAVADAERDEEGGGQGEAYETHLPTASALADTALALIDVHLDIWDAISPPIEPSVEQQTRVSTVIAAAARYIPPERQAELDLAEIKVLLSLDRIIWALYRSTATLDSGWDRSLLGAIGALEALARSLDQPSTGGQVDVTVQADILVTLADTHSALANRSLFLSAQLPPGPTHLAQNAWLHLTASTERLNSALALPKTISTSREFAPSVLLDLAGASLARAKLWTVNDTARRNVDQLVENALAYNQKAIDGLGVGFVELGTSQVVGDTGHPRGWDAEMLGRETILQRIRILLYCGNTDVVAGQKERCASEAVDLARRAKGIGNAQRRVSQRDVERYLEELDEDEGGMGEDEKGWWKAIAGHLGIRIAS